MSDKTTDFGYKKVNIEEKAGKVAEVFHSVAGNYDLMNDLMSGGIHRLWKRVTIEMSGARSGHTVLDIAGGTGDLAAKFSRIVGPEGTVVLADINDSMLKVGRDRLGSVLGGDLEPDQCARARAHAAPPPRLPLVEEWARARAQKHGRLAFRRRATPRGRVQRHEPTRACVGGRQRLALRVHLEEGDRCLRHELGAVGGLRAQARVGGLPLGRP